jgi:hypothetical protein
MKYQICEIIDRDVCVPSQDYYSRGDTWSNQSINEIISFDPLYDTIEDALKHFNETNYRNGTYTILPILIKH